MPVHPKARARTAVQRKLKRKTVTLPIDILGLASFLVRGGNGQSVYTDDYIHLLREIAEELPENRVAKHIAWLAFDNLPFHIADALSAWHYGKASLLPETERFLRDRGFLYGAKAKLPEAAIDYIETRWGWLYGNQQ